jgi:peptide/nickel transport system ATP-binding protein
MSVCTMTQVSSTYRAWFRPPNQALRHASFEIAQGERVGIVGPSGGGKSTLIRCALGLRAIDAGTIRWFGEDTSDWTASRWATLRQRVQWLPQHADALLHPRMPIGRLLEASARHHQPEGAAQQLAAQAMEDVGLSHRRDALPHELSGGEKRRATIARVRLARPAVLVADEPTAGLDAERKEGVFQALMGGGPQATVVIVSHDIASLAAVCQRLLVVADGTVIESLSAEELRDGTAQPVAQRTLQLLADAGWRSLRGRTS